MSILKVEDLWKNFGKKRSFKGINLEIESPGIYALIGPNGAGKTTLFNIISNLLKPSKGKIEVVGKKNTDTSIFYEVSFLKDNRVLYSYLSGMDHLNFIRRVQKLPKERIDEVINLMSLESFINKPTGSYSLGMKQQLLIAMAIMNKPKLMILDEPLNGLDPTAVIKVRLLLKEMAKNGSSILISSHTLSQIDLLTNNIFFLKDGVLLEEKLDIDNQNIYKVKLEGDYEEKLNRFKESGFDSKISDGVLTVNLKDQKLEKLIASLQEMGLDYSELTKIKLGSEERYIRMFPEEVEKVKK